MTHLLHLRDGYLQEFEAAAVALCDGGVVLDATAFYPRGRGQPSDQGVLLAEGVQYPVVEVRKEGDEVVHLLAGEAPPVGSRAKGGLGRQRRYALTRHHRHHCALHVLCGVIHSLLGPLVTGWQMYPVKAQMEIALEGLVRRFPDLRLAVPESELPWHSGEINHTLTSLPVVWGV